MGRFGWIHVVYGMLSMALFMIDRWVGLLNILFFHVYEYSEYFVVGDRLYLDLREFYTGAALVSFLYLLVRSLGWSWCSC